MAIDLNSEELISLRDAARLLPARRKGKKPHISCLYRWTTVGCHSVVLESVSVGGTRCTSREALARFIASLSVDYRADPLAQGRADRREQQLHIDQQLDDEGIT